MTNHTKAKTVMRRPRNSSDVVQVVQVEVIYGLHFKKAINAVASSAIHVFDSCREVFEHSIHIGRLVKVLNHRLYVAFLITSPASLFFDLAGFSYIKPIASISARLDMCGAQYVHPASKSTDSISTIKGRCRYQLRPAGAIQSNQEDIRYLRYFSQYLWRRVIHINL